MNRKEYIRNYQRQWMRNRRMEYFTGKQCVRCGSRDNLELDHIDKTKKIDHKIWSWAKERREIELAKCQPLCHDCHKTKTIVEMKRAPHGGPQMYDNGCRCDLCREFKSKKNAKRNKKRPFSSIVEQ